MRNLVTSLTIAGLLTVLLDLGGCAGAGSSGSLSVTPNQIVFPDHPNYGTNSAPLPVTVTNVSGSPVALNIAVTVQGNYSIDFTESSCQGVTLPPAASCILTLTYAPVFGGGQQGQLVITPSQGAPISIGISAIPGPQ
jgi:hypothetical protein